jgi:hypothetical protein
LHNRLENDYSVDETGERDVHVATAGELTLKPSQEDKKSSTWTAPTLIAVLALTAILLHLVLRYVSNVPQIVWQAPLVLALIAGGVPLLLRLTRKLFEREFGSDHLAGISIVTSPDFFEQLVVTLLTTMGYGGSLADAGRAIGKTGDSGVEGVIREDKLGPDLLYIQAKRWENTTVGTKVR